MKKVRYFETYSGALLVLGKIKSVKNIASELHILLDCQEIQPDIYLILSVEKELKIGQVIKVMA